MSPVLVDPFLGAGGFWLRNVGADLVPPVSWMGGKRRLADDLLALLDLRPGRPVSAILGDASWWGWVWPTCLHPTTGPQVSETLRSWRDEDARALWFRLRDAGPMEERAEAAAQLLWLQARAASGVPVWWEGDEVAAPGDGRSRQRAADRGSNGTAAVLDQDRGWKSETCESRRLFTATQGSADEVKEDRRERRAPLIQWASTKIDGAGQKGTAHGRPGGIVDPGTIANRIDAIRALVRDVAVYNIDATDLTVQFAPLCGTRARVYLDPPYQGATGYPKTCDRQTVLCIADTWARHGARVVLSEAVGLASDLGRGWAQVQLRTGKKEEWVTVYGCDIRAVLPPILRGCA